MEFMSSVKWFHGQFQGSTSSMKAIIIPICILSYLFSEYYTLIPHFVSVHLEKREMKD